MMSLEEKAMVEKIFSRYHSAAIDAPADPTQVAFDIGWLIGLIAKLEHLEGWLTD